MMGRVGWLMAVSLVVAGCGEAEKPPVAAPSASVVVASPAAPSPTPSVTPSPTPKPDGFVAKDVEDLGRLCGLPRKKAASSVKFAGPGPYPMLAYFKEADDDGYSRLALSQRKYRLGYPELASLIACATGTKGKRVGTCTYGTGDDTFKVEVIGQRYTVEVFALDTGKRIARKKLVPPPGCPRSVSVPDPDRPPKIVYATVSSEQIDAVIGPFYKE